MQLLNLKKAKTMTAAMPANAISIPYVFHEDKKYWNSLFKHYDIADKIKFSNIRKIIDISTDQKTIDSSKHLQHFLNTIIDEQLPVAYTDIELTKKNLEYMKKTVSDINMFFEMLNSVLGGKYNADDILIDDKNLNKLISIMEIAKVDALYVINYLHVLIEVDSFKKAKKKKCNIDDFVNLIESAA